jgi:hypothetical protein
MKKFLLGLLALLASASAFAATTYSYTGPAYTLATGTFNTSMHITGFFTTATPLTPNLSDVNITGQVTSYSFSDGINSYASSDANARIFAFLVSTDASGNMTNWSIVLKLWETGTSPHSAGDKLSIMRTRKSILWGDEDSAVDYITCSIVGVSSSSGVSDVCIVEAAGTWLGDATTQNTTGSWTSQTAVTATSIPTLSEWGMILLSSLLAVGTMLTLRRKRQ